MDEKVRVLEVGPDALRLAMEYDDARRALQFEPFDAARLCGGIGSRWVQVAGWYVVTQDCRRPL